MSDGASEVRELVLGFVALTDAAPLVVAKEKGMFRRHGLSVRLSREASWASVRDKVALGMLDAAQMLAPMPIAASLGLGPLAVPTVAPMTLDLNGNAITVSAGLFAAMAGAELGWGNGRPRRATALATLLARGHRRPVLAVVHPYSTHNYQLRCWLAEGGVDPERDVDLVVIPPQQMVEKLEQGSIDGFCVGEPWNQVAVRRGVGCLVITSHELWPGATEKVLGVTASWAERHPQVLSALVRALVEACAWADRLENRLEVARLLAHEHHVGAPIEAIAYPLLGLVQERADTAPRALPDAHVFFRGAANRPRASHAVRYAREMRRWGQLDDELTLARARTIFRADLFRRALRAGRSLP
jgi:ABC-type nitrate/sulfonate/bicarbonate transport system substrate-binding protein